MITKINEYISNFAFATHLIGKFCERINKVIPIEYKSNFDDVNSLKYSEMVEKVEGIERLVKKQMHIFTENHLITGAMKKYDSVFIAIKQQYTQRYYPNQGYLYHMTSSTENLKNIKVQGLLLRSSNESKEWSDQVELTYPPAVFATIPPDTWHGVLDGRVIKIITKGLPNKWWYDVNLFGLYKSYLLTYKPIPPEFLEFMMPYEDGDTEIRWIPAKDWYPI